MSSIGRNDPCSCGSGMKYKKCCIWKSDPYFILQNVSRYPIYKCLINKGWKGSGMANVLIVRENKEIGKYLFGMFLVDTYCLGVKDALYNANVDLDKIENEIIVNMPDGMVLIDYEDCRGLIFGAIDFARNIGFEPHDDFNIAKGFIEPEKPYKTKHKFGRNGKPFYITGPHDNVEKILKVLGKDAPDLDVDDGVVFSD